MGGGTVHCPRCTCSRSISLRKSENHCHTAVVSIKSILYPNQYTLMKDSRISLRKRMIVMYFFQNQALRDFTDIKYIRNGELVKNLDDFYYNG